MGNAPLYRKDYFFTQKQLDELHTLLMQVTKEKYKAHLK